MFTGGLCKPFRNRFGSGLIGMQMWFGERGCTLGKLRFPFHFVFSPVHSVGDRRKMYQSVLSNRFRTLRSYIKHVFGPSQRQRVSLSLFRAGSSVVFSILQNLTKPIRKRIIPNVLSYARVYTYYYLCQLLVPWSGWYDSNGLCPILLSDEPNWLLGTGLA